MSSQVKRKAAEADEMIRQLAQQGDEQASAISDTTDEAEAQPTAEVVELDSEGSQDSLASTGDTVGHSPDSLEAQMAELREEARKADARWRSLQGQVDSKDRQIEQLHALLANMQSAPEPEAEAEPELPIGFTQADRDAFGDDMIDLMQRVSREAARQEAERSKSTIAELQAQLEGVTKVTASTVQDSFEEKLTKLSPNWEELNVDNDFIVWLSEENTRKQLFDSAAQAKNAKGVAEFFNLYSQLKGLQSAPDPKAGKRDQLERQVAPGKTRAPAPVAASTPEEKIWTRSEIASFYKSKGSMQADDFAKTEREISKAMAENRVDYAN